MASKKAVPNYKKKSNKNLKPAPKPASEQQAASGKNVDPESKPSGKPRGRKANATITNPGDTSLAPGVAGSNLRNAINVAVASQSDRIATALVQEAVKGNTGSAKLLIEISGARNPEPKKRPSGPTPAEILMREPQWQDPPGSPPWGDPYAKVDAPFGGREPEL